MYSCFQVFGYGRVVDVVKAYPGISPTRRRPLLRLVTVFNQILSDV